MSENVKSTNIPNGRWLHILPPLVLVYIVAFMDRTNISFALAGGMDAELGMNATITGLASGIFFFGYMFLQVPGGRIAERASAKKFIACTIIAWGGFAVLSGLANSTIQILVIRFLLGVAEGGVWPAILTIISHWFPAHERGRANAIFMMNAPIASIITGPLSGFIVTAFSWRYVFIIEGAIAIALLFIWFPLVADHPKDAKWISKEERDYIEKSIHQEQIALSGTASSKKIPISQVLSSKLLWILCIIYGCYQAGIYGYSLWLPKIIQGVSKASMSGIGLLSTIPNIIAIFGLIYFSKKSDRTMNRKRYTALPMIGFAICLFISVQFKIFNPIVSFAFIALCGFFLYSANSVFWTIPSQIFESDMAAQSRGVINIIGGLGSFLGPYMVGFLTTDISASAGLYALIILLVVGFISTVLLPIAKNNA
ncbi:MAG: MFS transporter [Clostridium sp.]|jgi:sugar phosphate permease|uniref:MFS transporter n=1 Tax=Clostridium sp. TaxID=1506 RepID=UPI0025C0E635|nr:MFS transporter [Clostridium sp.]MCH3964903.1 MFS transporter [Clostridium sp.]MCI1716603.1 MFS transporter [Clostridium sp.]MCI1800915.1 MFS transporter [Clostridium sp.]MCI1814780.1 MFS transporter [Clostridium sp.]MCI1871662.1 MFS transporter [Clostridium sp.]